MGAGTVIVNALLGLLIIATVGCFAYAGYLVYQSTNIQVGAVVQTSFTGNVAFLTSALLGPRGELASTVAPQDALNALYCDVPGSAGAYSSWYRPAGSAAQYDPYTQASYTSVWNSSYSCEADGDCNSKPWLQCGKVANVWEGGTYSGAAAWSDTLAANACGSANNDPTDPNNWMVCSFTSADETSGVCSITRQVDGEAPFMCNTATSRCVPRAALASGVTTCSASGPASQCASVPAGVCNTLSGFCTPDWGEHVLLNTPWLAEGTVASVNADGSFNVNWTRIKNMYNFKGPSLPWFPPNTTWSYGDCVFVAGSDPLNSASSANANNQGATAMALGMGSLGIDVAGLPTLSSDNAYEPTTPNVWNTVEGAYGWMGSLSTDQTMMGLPTLAQVGTASSAWGLQAMSLTKDSLKRVPAYTIKNTAATAWNTHLLASVTDFRCEYMGDRPPHLQWAGATC